MSKYTLKIISPDDVIYQGQVENTTITTPSGEQAYLCDHWDSVVEVAIGVIYVYPENGQRDPIKIAVNGGVATFQNNKLTVSTIDAEMLIGRKPNLQLFPASIVAKDSDVQDQINQALKQGGVYVEDKLAIASLLAEERMAKVQLLNELIKG